MRNDTPKINNPKLWQDYTREEKRAYWHRADLQIARRARLARLLRGIDTTKAAQALTLSADNLRQIERGKLRLSAETLLRMSCLYGQSAEDLIGPVAMPPPPARPTATELGRSESRLLLGAFSRIKKTAVRHQLAELAVQIAADLQRRQLRAGVHC
ncbi:hypothetical protein [Radicibacter daui]|uniref:hypothetical protein n=1 Tax=Radicibacter daui TaxID=3064829 RepID=UPI0040469919